MANQALINAAQRMYSAKAAKAQKDITPILSGVASATDNIMNAVTVKRKEQQEESQKQIESFKDILLKNPKLRPELTGRLEQLQEEYYNNLKIAEGAFVGKKRKADAIEANNKIADQLKKYESQLNSVDLNKSLNTSFSKFNMLGDQVDDTIFRDKTLIDNVVLQDDGFYFKNHKGELKPLDEYKPLMQVNEKGITSLVSGFTAAENAGFKGRSYTGGIEQQVDTLINFELGADKNYQSILFDDIGTFNYAEANLQQEIDAGRIDGKLSKSEQLEKFKENIKANPDFYRQDFKNDYVAVVKQANANALSQYEAEKQEVENRRTSGDKKPYQLTTNAQYVGKDYIEDVYDQIKRGDIIVGSNTYFRDKDGLFYSSDSNSKLVKSEGAEGLTDQAIARLRGVDTFASEFGYEFAKKEEKPSVELPDYLNPMGDRDKDNVPNTIDRPNIPFPAITPGKI
tara:strand:+ start:420 stop:1787 length:1368 start_codon:yes stop_codon:yes gene_type:complete